MRKHHINGKVHSWLVDALPADVSQAIDRLAREDDVARVAVMPDVHLAHEVCIGTVVATRDLLYPGAVGSDIGCGMAAVRFDVDASLLQDEANAARTLSACYQLVPSNRHSKATLPEALPDDLLQHSLSDPHLDKLKSRDGRVQLEALGRGNHFVEFQTDDSSNLWLMVHCGSRGIGQAIASHHLDRAQIKGKQLSRLDAASERGREYLNDVEWALRYAEHNRLAIVSNLAEFFKSAFGVEPVWETLVHDSHNHVRRETHMGQDLWVHRKGAQSAQQDELGVIPGSMGTSSFHVAGRGYEEALCSSSHGAGRRMSRHQARHTIQRKEMLRQLQDVWFDRRRVDALRDEAPGAYKDIHAVMRAQRQLTRIVRELRPVLNYKGC